MKYLFLLFPLIFLLLACNQDALVIEKWKFPDGHWVVGDKKTMVITASDTSQVYKLDIEVDHNLNYQYQNLYVRTVTVYPSGKEVISISSLELANSDGSWAGHCNHEGKFCRILLPLQQNFTFPEPGEYSWSIEPYMRVDTIEGINKIVAECRKVTTE